MEKLKKLLKKIRSNKVLLFLSILLVLTVITFVLLISGQLNCEEVHIKEGVKQTCTCRGIEVDVKSTILTAERVTVCLGITSNTQTY